MEITLITMATIPRINLAKSILVYITRMEVCRNRMVWNVMSSCSARRESVSQVPSTSMGS
jgi:hypothetical protein